MDWSDDPRHRSGRGGHDRRSRAGGSSKPPISRSGTGFRSLPRLRERLQQRPTILLNDANAAAFGEYWAGAGRSTESLACSRSGTGIGCGIVESAGSWEGRHGVGGECGHMTDPDGRGTALLVRQKRPPGSLRLGDLAGPPGDPRPSKVGPTRSLRDLPGRRGPSTAEAIARCARRGRPPGRSTDARDGPLPGGRGLDRHPHRRPRSGPLRRRDDRGRRRISSTRSESGSRSTLSPAASDEDPDRFASLGGDAGFIGAAGWAQEMVRA